MVTRMQYISYLALTSNIITTISSAVQHYQTLFCFHFVFFKYFLLRRPLALTNLSFVHITILDQSTFHSLSIYQHHP